MRAFVVRSDPPPYPFTQNGCLFQFVPSSYIRTRTYLCYSLFRQARECCSSDIHCGNMSALGMGMLRRERRWLRGYPEMSALASIHPHFILLTFFFAHAVMAGLIYVTPIARKPGGVLHTYSLVTHFFRPHLLRCPRLMSPFPLFLRRESEGPAPRPPPPPQPARSHAWRAVTILLVMCLGPPCTRGFSS